MRLFILVAVVTVAVVFLPAARGTDKAELMKEKAAELRQLRERYEAQRLQMMERIKTFEEKKRWLTEAKDKMANEVSENERIVNELKANCENLSNEIDAYKNRIDSFSAIIGQGVVELERRIRCGLPYLVTERLKPILSFEEEKTGDLQKSLSTVFDVYAKELRLAQSWDAYRDFLDHPDGRKLRGYILRAGLVLMFFVSDTGEVAYVTRGEDGTVRWRFVNDSSLHRSLREIVRYVRKQTIPDVILVPVPREMFRR